MYRLNKYMTKILIVIKLYKVLLRIIVLKVETCDSVEKLHAVILITHIELHRILSLAYTSVLS